MSNEKTVKTENTSSLPSPSTTTSSSSSSSSSSTTSTSTTRNSTGTSSPARTTRNPNRNSNSSTNNSNNNNNNNNNSNSNKQQQQQQQHNRSTNNNVTTEASDEDDTGGTRKWRSNSTRGLKTFKMGDVSLLVVDDDPVQRTVLKKWLHDAGYQNLTICDSGRQAWDKLNEPDANFDLVVTDLMMPEIGGDILLEWIKNHPKYGSSLPVILMSGEDKTEETAASAISIGSQDFLYKPLIRALFLRKIATVLENMLIKEREAAYETLMKEKEEEIKKLTSEVYLLSNENIKVMKAIESPIEGIARTLSNILSDESLRDLPVKQELENIFLTIRTNKDLYAPAIQELLKQDMNPEAKSLLLSCTENNLARRASIPTFPVVVRQDSIAGLKNWDFNPFLYTDKDLLALIKNMFESFGLMERFQIPVQNLEQFLLAVQKHYHNNQYHNFYHAFDVMQTVYCILSSMGGAVYLTHLDIFALLTAALCHDVGHPGLTNTFLINSENELAMLYNDRSVLECHHSSLAFRLLKKPEYDLLKHLSPVEKKELRTTMITCILATDMAHHFTNTGKLEQRVKLGKPFDRDNKDDRLMLLEAILKAADISNTGKPWTLALEWAKRVAEEGFLQGDIERKENRWPVPEHLDRTKTTFAKNTANFIDLFAVHLYKLVAEVLPDLKIALAQMFENRKQFADIIKEQEKQKEEALAQSAAQNSA